MGIHYYQYLIYGVRLNNQEAEKLDALLRSKNPDDEDDSLEYTFSHLNMNDMVLAGDGAMCDLHHGNGFVPLDKDGSVINGYYLGVDLGSNTSQHMNIIKKEVTQEMKDKWSHIQPYLKEAQINVAKPDFHFYSNSG